MKRIRVIAAGAVMTATLAAGVGIAAAQMGSGPSTGPMSGQMQGRQMQGQMGGRMNGQSAADMDARHDQMRSTMTADEQAQCDQHRTAMDAGNTDTTPAPSSTPTTLG